MQPKPAATTTEDDDNGSKLTARNRARRTNTLTVVSTRLTAARIYDD